MAAARTLLLYAALPDEVPTKQIAAEAWNHGKQVVLPRVDREGWELALYRVGGWEELRPGAYGIAEPDPARCAPVAVEQIDAALIPGLAWDRRGGRLGRGGGFYDRLLASSGWRAFRCGLFFAAQEVSHIPLEDWDVLLNAVVTEGEVWRGLK